MIQAMGREITQFPRLSYWMEQLSTDYFCLLFSRYSSNLASWSVRHIRTSGGTWRIAERDGGVTVFVSSPPTLKESRSARVLQAETFTTKAQDTGTGRGARHCILTTRTIESSSWSRRSVVSGSDGINTGVRLGFLGALAGCAVDLTAQNTAIAEVIVRIHFYTCVAHGVGYVC